MAACRHSCLADDRKRLLFKFLAPERGDHSYRFQVLLHYGHYVALLLAYFVGRALDCLLEP